MRGGEGFRIVLVRPRNPLNIGAAARAMANFGLRDLAVAEPHAPVWREARSAVGAGGVLARARSGTLPEALQGCGLVLGTCDARRRPGRPVVGLPALASWIAGRLGGPRRTSRGGQGAAAAILFGSEKTGLRNRDLDRCHAVVSIPTSPGAPSMNLGQAVALVAYELAGRAGGAAVRETPEPLPTAEQLDDLVRRAVAAFDALDFMRASPREAKERRIRLMLARCRPVQGDAALIQGLLRRLERRLASREPSRRPHGDFQDVT